MITAVGRSLRRRVFCVVGVLAVASGVWVWLQEGGTPRGRGREWSGQTSPPVIEVRRNDERRPRLVKVDQQPEIPNEILREIEETFARSLPQIREQTSRFAAERESLIQQHPLIVQGPEFARHLQEQVLEKYGGAASEVDRLRKVKPREMGVIDRDLPSLLLPQSVTRALSADDKIGETSLAAITAELLAETDYVDELRETQERSFSRLLPGAQISLPPEGDGLQTLKYLNAMADSFAKAQSNVIPPGVIDEHAYEYLVEKCYADQVWCMMQSYARSWTAELDRREARMYDEQVLPLRKMLERIPSDSLEHGQLEAQLILAVRYGK